jgi:hypothetical protein
MLSLNDLLHFGNGKDFQGKTAIILLLCSSASISGNPANRHFAEVDIWDDSMNNAFYTVWLQIRRPVFDSQHYQKKKK